MNANSQQTAILGWLDFLDLCQNLMKKSFEKAIEVIEFVSPVRAGAILIQLAPTSLEIQLPCSPAMSRGIQTYNRCIWTCWIYGLRDGDFKLCSFNFMEQRSSKSEVRRNGKISVSAAGEIWPQQIEGIERLDWPKTVDPVIQCRLFWIQLGSLYSR